MDISKNNIKSAIIKYNDVTKFIIKDSEIKYFKGNKSIFVELDFKFLHGSMLDKLIFYRLYHNDNKIYNIKYLGSKLKNNRKK